MHHRSDNSKKDGGNDMSLEARVAVLESAITYIKDGIQRIDARLDNMDKKLDSRLDIFDRKLTNDFRWLFALIIGLAGFMAHGFHWI